MHAEGIYGELAKVTRSDQGQCKVRSKLMKVRKLRLMKIKDLFVSDI